MRRIKRPEPFSGRQKGQGAMVIIRCDWTRLKEKQLAALVDGKLNILRAAVKVFDGSSQSSNCLQVVLA
jgi:hypothetical protein